jgi:hypothetical protein
MDNVIRVGRAKNDRGQEEVFELLMRIKGVVFARAILEERGFGPEVIEEHTREIERLRERLALLVREGYGAAA